MHWITKIEMDIDDALSMGVRDSYSWHQKVWDFFPGRPIAKRDFLTRFDHGEEFWRIWIVSEVRPQKPDWCAEDTFALKEISPEFFKHRHYTFDLLANPVKSLVQKDEQGKPLLDKKGKRKRGKRVPIIKQDELRNWLIRKTEVRAQDPVTGEPITSGVRIVKEHPLEISPMQQRHFRKKEHAGYHGGVQFRGVLEVTDRNQFMATYKAGIGSAKGFGFGLLLLAPVQL